MRDPGSSGSWNRRSRRGRKADTGPTCLGTCARSSGVRSPAGMAIRPWSAMCRNALWALALLMAHHQNQRTPAPTAVPTMPTSGWASSHSLSAGLARSERIGRIEAAREIAQGTHPDTCESHDGENQPLRCQTRNLLRRSLTSALKRRQSFVLFGHNVRFASSLRCVQIRMLSQKHRRRE